MRLVILTLLLRSTVALSQTTLSCQSVIDTLTKQRIYPSPSLSASPKGGMETLHKKIFKDIRLSSKELGAKVHVAFIITDDGRITGKRIVRDFNNPDLARQVLTIIDRITWYPARCGGKSVSTIYALPVIIDAK